MVRYVYDTNGGLESINYPDPCFLTPETLFVSYGYDPDTGRLESIAAPDATLEYSYDGSLLKTESWKRNSTTLGTVTWTYNTDLQPASVSVSGGSTVEFAYDRDGLLEQAGELGLTPDTQAGLLDTTTISVQNGSTVADDRDYTQFGELERYSATLDNDPLFEVDYDRDKLGRIKTLTEKIDGTLNRQRTYGYDDAGRLRDVFDDPNAAPIAHYEYDDNGNRKAGSYTQSAQWTDAVYDNQDRLVSYTTEHNNTITTTNLTYTPNGELQTKTVNGDTTSYTYDAMGNLRQVRLHAGDANAEVIIEYLVDGRNRRIGKRKSPASGQAPVLERQWLYHNELSPIAELDGDNNVVAQFERGFRDVVTSLTSRRKPLRHTGAGEGVRVSRR
jgi:YD repeat-containing protein